MSAKLIMNYERDVFMRDIAEGYAKGNHTTDEFLDLLEHVANEASPQPAPEQPERTIGDVYNELQKLINIFNQ